MRCSVEDVKTVLTELRTGSNVQWHAPRDGGMRAEAGRRRGRTFGYYQSIWAEDANAAPRFLWNAKMRFGETTTYQLARSCRPSACWC